METNQKVYVLELLGDISNTPGMITLETGGVSLNRSKLETLKIQKEKELDDYLDARPIPEDDDEDDDTDEEYCYQNFDLSSRPVWTITEYDMI
jgi:hypothetical protein